LELVIFSWCTIETDETTRIILWAAAAEEE
jgi:hypothetical protein